MGASKPGMTASDVHRQPVLGVRGNFTSHTLLTAHNSFVLVLAETGITGHDPARRSATAS